MNDHDASAIARELGALIGDAQVRPPRGCETRAALVIAEPRETGEVSALVRKCESDELALAPLGAARTLCGIRETPAAVGISLARMDRVVAYEPADMTIVAEAGATVAALNQLMAPRGQRLPADPPRPDLTTLGALAGAAQAGPVRLSEGTVRDLAIGITFVGHDGRIVHGGGRVVKNVAGYDLMKVMIGSFGTLGVITELTFKVRPAPERYTIALAAFRDLDSAFAVAGLLHDAAAPIHLEVAGAAASRALGYADGFNVIAGFGGSAPEAAHLRAQFAAMLGGNTEFRDGPAAIADYERLRDLDLESAPMAALIAVAPAELARCVKDSHAEFIAHAGCGVARIFVDCPPDPAAIRNSLVRIREIARAARGNLRVLRVAPELREGLRFFDEPPRPALDLMRRMKAAFDPHAIFNPGCFVGGL